MAPRGNKNAVGNKGGRPTSYRPEFAKIAKERCQRYGATDAELADEFDVAISTIHVWQSKIPEFSEALNAGKEAYDKRIERRLADRAMGYSFDAEKIHVHADGKVTRVKYREHVPPDTTAMIFWLKNRQRDKWRDRQDVVVTTEFDDMSESQLKTWIAEKEAALKAGKTKH